MDIQAGPEDRFVPQSAGREPSTSVTGWTPLERVVSDVITITQCLKAGLRAGDPAHPASVQLQRMEAPMQRILENIATLQHESRSGPPRQSRPRAPHAGECDAVPVLRDVIQCLKGQRGLEGVGVMWAPPAQEPVVVGVAMQAFRRLATDLMRYVGSVCQQIPGVDYPRVKLLTVQCARQARIILAMDGPCWPATWGMPLDPDRGWPKIWQTNVEPIDPVLEEIAQAVERSGGEVWLANREIPGRVLELIWTRPDQVRT